MLTGCSTSTFVRSGHHGINMRMKARYRVAGYMIDEMMGGITQLETITVPPQVSYVLEGGLLYLEGETATGLAQVVARFLRTGVSRAHSSYLLMSICQTDAHSFIALSKYLVWDHVRVMGGAHGGFCTFLPYSGYFSFLSYRDPNLSKTFLDVMMRQVMP
jgi:hypothetical protein